jgi:hypothetical protein
MSRSTFLFRQVQVVPGSSIEPIISHKEYLNFPTDDFKNHLYGDRGDRDKCEISYEMLHESKHINKLDFSAFFRRNTIPEGAHLLCNVEKIKITATFEGKAVTREICGIDNLVRTYDKLNEPLRSSMYKAYNKVKDTAYIRKVHGSIIDLIYRAICETTNKALNFFLFCVSDQMARQGYGYTLQDAFFRNNDMTAIAAKTLMATEHSVLLNESAILCKMVHCLWTSEQMVNLHAPEVIRKSLHNVQTERLLQSLKSLNSLKSLESQPKKRKLAEDTSVADKELLLHADQELAIVQRVIEPSDLNKAITTITRNSSNNIEVRLLHDIPTIAILENPSVGQEPEQLYTDLQNPVEGSLDSMMVIAANAASTEASIGDGKTIPYPSFDPLAEASAYLALTIEQCDNYRKRINMLNMTFSPSVSYDKLVLNLPPYTPHERVHLEKALTSIECCYIASRQKCAFNVIDTVLAPDILYLIWIREIVTSDDTKLLECVKQLSTLFKTATDANNTFLKKINSKINQALGVTTRIAEIKKLMITQIINIAQKYNTQPTDTIDLYTDIVEILSIINTPVNGGKLYIWLQMQPFFVNYQALDAMSASQSSVTTEDTLEINGYNIVNLSTQQDANPSQEADSGGPPPGGGGLSNTSKSPPRRSPTGDITILCKGRKAQAVYIGERGRKYVRLSCKSLGKPTKGYEYIGLKEARAHFSVSKTEKAATPLPQRKAPATPESKQQRASRAASPPPPPRKATPTSSKKKPATPEIKPRASPQRKAPKSRASSATLPSPSPPHKVRKSASAVKKAK